MKQVAVAAGKIFTGNEWLEQKAVLLTNGKVAGVVDWDHIPADAETFDAREHFIAPAFVDLQIYGAHGKLLAVHPTLDALDDLYNYCTSGGCSHFLPTLATNTMEVFRTGIDLIKAYWKKGGKGILGLHLEGPWINKEKRGAHVEELVHAPDVSEVNDLLEYGEGVIRMITLAPEVCSKQIIDIIRSKGIVISAGHSNATLVEAREGFRNGITAVTHLYNAMSGLHHREPGLVGAVFSDDTVSASIIPDGYHVDYDAVSIAKKIMGERLFVITDAVTETTSGPYQHQREGDKYVCNGTLSGSALTMHKAFKNLVDHAGISVEEALRMCSLYPARVIRMDGYLGKIAPQAAGQFVVLNKRLDLVRMAGYNTAFVIG